MHLFIVEKFVFQKNWIQSVTLLIALFVFWKTNIQGQRPHVPRLVINPRPAISDQTKVQQ